MLKRLTVAVAALFALAGSSFAAGTIPFSLSQQLDQYGKPLAGCQFYTIQAGTVSTPQNAYQDSALSFPLPNPQTCDSAGRLPQMFLADGTIKVRLTDKNGVTQVVADNIQVIGASSGSGGGGTVDPTTILATGDIKSVYGTGVLSGFVRLNGRTIGSSTSGATERANLDCLALFEYLWGADPNLVVSTGRGVSAAADWSANKQLTLPDGRGRSLAAMTDMGATASTIWDPALFTTGSNGTTLGATVGQSVSTIAQGNFPNVNFALSGSLTVTSNQHFIPSSMTSSATVDGTSGSRFGVLGPSSGTGPAVIGDITSTGSLASPNCTSCVAASGGSGTALQTASPFIFVTLYMKL